MIDESTEFGARVARHLREEIVVWLNHGLSGEATIDVDARADHDYLAKYVTVADAIEDDGMPRSSRLLHLEDRVGALAGTLELGATTLRAEIPCE